MILLISASQIAQVTGVSYQRQADKSYLENKLEMGYGIY
jgi:hypothetical protein